MPRGVTPSFFHSPGGTQAPAEHREHVFAGPEVIQHRLGHVVRDRALVATVDRDAQLGRKRRQLGLVADLVAGGFAFRGGGEDLQDVRPWSE